MKLNYNTELGRYVEEIFDFYLPLLLKLPQLRDNPAFMRETVKATGRGGLTDVATQADLYVQAQVKAYMQRFHPDWQFWGEEDRKHPWRNDAHYLIITDPIEGTNNFKFKKESLWGSVIALVDMQKQEPVIGIVAQPAQQRLFVGIKGEGAYTVSFGSSGVTFVSGLIPPNNAFTYNNSPHFELQYQRRVDGLFMLGTVQADKPRADKIDKGRKTVLLDGHRFLDVEAGALEPVLYAGGIMFKTNIEIAASFAILNETGGKITAANGEQWSLGILDCIFARKAENYEFLKGVYDRTGQIPEQNK